jgi:hypothetical protein
MPGGYRAVLIALLIGAGPLLSGCADFDMDKLDVFGLNKKPKLPGERHDVFPGGVPGVTQGIPPELMKGHENEQVGAAVPLNQPAPAVQPAAEKTTAAAAPAEAKPKPAHKRKVTRAKTEPAPQPAPAAPQATAQPAAQPAPPAGGWPPPAAPEQASPWPAPLPSGTFSKQ